MPKKQIGKKIDEQGNLTDLGYTVTQEEINNWNNKVDKDSYQEITGQKVFSKPIRTGNANSENDFRIGTEIDQSGVITCKNDMDGANFRTIVKIPTIKDTIIDINLPQKSGTIATTDDIPTNNNQLTNGAEYINKDVNNLTNYTLATNTASSIEMSIDNSTYLVSLKLKNAEGTQLGETQTIDLPLESVVVNGAYDSTTKEVILTLDNGNEIRFSVADLVSGLATTTDLANYVPTSRTVNGKALSSNISLGNKDVGALPDYTLTITHQSAGNPRMVKFASVNYSSKATCFKMAAMTCHDNGVSYQFLTDMLISVTTAGKVTANIYKFAQSSIGSVDGVARYTGDVFYVNDTTNKIVDFYILCGQWSASQFTPVTKVGSTTIANVTQYSGSATYYSSGTKEWASGCGTTYARSNEIPTKTSELENDSNFATTSDLNTYPKTTDLYADGIDLYNYSSYLDIANALKSNPAVIGYGRIGNQDSDGNFKTLLPAQPDEFGNYTEVYVQLVRYTAAGYILKFTALAQYINKPIYEMTVHDDGTYTVISGWVRKDTPTQQEKEFLTNEYEKSKNLAIDTLNNYVLTDKFGGQLVYERQDGDSTTLCITLSTTNFVDTSVGSGAIFRCKLIDGTTNYILASNFSNDGINSVIRENIKELYLENHADATGTINWLQIENGSTYTGYQPYNGSIVHEKDINGVKIWENASPNANFINQTITISDSTNYKYLTIIYRQFWANQGCAVAKFRLHKGTEYGLSVVNNGPSNKNNYFRGFNETSSTQINFLTCFDKDGAVDDRRLIPLEMYLSNY